MAELTIGNHTLQSLKKPVERSNDCWNLVPGKNTKLLLPQNSLLIKTGESLFDWRSNNSISFQHSKEKYIGINSSVKNGKAEDKQEQHISGIDLPDGMGKLMRGKDYRCISIKMRHSKNLVTDVENELLHSEEPQNDDNAVPYPYSINSPLSELLTIIVTTSPIRSNPSTEVLEKAFETFKLAGFDFAYNCKKVIVCDGVRVQEEEIDEETKRSIVTRKHTNVKQALRNGIANQEQATKYKQFKVALRKLCDKADQLYNDLNTPLSDASQAEIEKLLPFSNTNVVELDERHGYGFALREALQKAHVQTPYVCVIQHDRTFMRKTPMEEVVKCIISQRDKVKYVGISMRSNLLYRDLFLNKYGKSSFDELEKMVIRPPELNLDADIYGKNGSSISEMISTVSKGIRGNIIALQKTYFNSYQGTSFLNWFKNSQTDLKEFPKRIQCSLTPTLFWYDNIHIVETKHYRDFIFNPKFKMVARGGFVEDKLSPVLVKSVERRGLVEGHRRFGCYLFDDHSGMFFTGHLDGGSYLTADEKKKKQEASQRKKDTNSNKV